MIDVFCGMKCYLASMDEIEQAKALGKRIEGRDGDYLIEAYQLGNRIYITDAGVKPQTNRTSGERGRDE